MASTMTTKPFNLIKRDVQLKESVKVEKDWYVLFNILFLCLIITLSGVSYLFKSYLKSGIDKKTEVLSQKINTKLNTSSKELIRSEINVVNDKFSIYQDFLDQNFDVNAFYDEFTALYPGLEIDKFSAQPNSKTIEIEVRIEANGYVEVTKFIKALENSAKFKNTVVKNVSFSMKDPAAITSKDKTIVDFVSTPETFITQLSLSINKIDTDTAK